MAGFFINNIDIKYNNFMKKDKKVKASSVEIKRYKWAFKMFIVSLCLSSLFSLFSQSVLSHLGAIFACFIIAFFIFISVVFDMIGIAVTSADEDFFKIQMQNEVSGSEVAFKLKKHSEKVCSFCADVVGDICGILSGAGGACIILSLAKNISHPSVVILISTLVSSLIAGLTILFKALMKGYAIKNSNKIILKLGRIIDKVFFHKKSKKYQKTVDKE